MGSTSESQSNSLTHTEDEAFLFAMQLCSASVLPMVLKSAVELDLLELMAKAGPGAAISPSELAAQLSTQNPEAPVMLDRMLRLLASYSVLNCTLRTLPDSSVERLYSLAPVCKYLTKNADGVSVAPLLLMNQDKVLMESWYHLKDAVLDGGIPFNKAYGMTAFEYHGTDPRFNKVFNRGMSDHSTMSMKKILEDYKGFEGLNSIVDVGGGTGATVNMIVSKYPSIKGINFDLPHVIGDAPTYPGVEHVGGDMFASVPKADAIFMKWICAYKQLYEVPGLAERMAALMCVDSAAEEAGDVEGDAGEEDSIKPSAVEIVQREIKEGGDDTMRWLELEELDIDDDMLLSLDLPNKFPNLLALSLCSNNLKDVEIVAKEVTRLKNLKALWLNNNPILERSNSETAIIQGCPGLEICNSKFTSNYGEWALGFCGGIYDKENAGFAHQRDHPLESVTSLDLSNRSIHNLINKAFNPDDIPSLSYLNLRGNPLDQNSLSDLLQLLKGFSCVDSLEVDIPGPLGESAAEIVEALPNLSLLNGVNTSKILESGKSVVDSMLQPRLPEWAAGDPLEDRVINAMWLYLMTYRLADEEKIDETSVWYVMDEFGSALRHSDKPNFRVSPFLYMPEGNLASAVSYSIIWPIDDVREGDECTRDYLFGIGEEKQRSARLTAWFHTPRNYFIKEYEKYKNKLQSNKFVSPVQGSSVTNSLCHGDGSALRVYTDIPPVEEYLTRPEFVITTEPKDADIIWTSMQIDEETKKAAGLNDEQYINQFPFEACLVMKHHLAETIQKAHGLVEWLQPTYNLETQLTQLIGDFHQREREKLDNLWILKPWNMARTIDTTITSNLSAIIRLMETGPKICQKYIEHPALFKGRKFDLRYIVLVRSMNPLEIFLAEVFWVRLANNTYTLEKHSFDEYETHFTVMNYRGRLNHMNTPDFVKEFEKEHKVNWLDIHSRIRRMITSAFEAAAVVHPEMHHSKSRAMYGVDVMLDCHFQPKLLEITYCPDCGRAVKYDTEAVVGGGETVKGKDFYNYIFGCLFLNETNHVSQL